jgi:hypothetical protein
VKEGDSFDPLEYNEMVVYMLRKTSALLLLGFCVVLQCLGATLTVTSTALRPSPSIVGYNSGHFVPDSNTADWWRYAGINGARVFITPALIEPADDLPGRGDGVADQAGFMARRAALRADPLSTAYINWSVLVPRYNLTLQHGSNLLNVDYTCRELRRLGIDLLISLTASESTFPITTPDDWAGKWELWQHYYAQAFHLGRQYNAQRFQMYNEPNHNNAISMSSYIERLRLISDAVQCAQEDLNSMFLRNLQPQMFAPVSAGTANSTYPSWGRLVVTNRHTDFLGASNPSFWLAGHYNYHEYNSAPVDFGAHLASLHTVMQADMSPEPRFPTTISEYNVHTASTFGGMTETLDSPSKYARFGGIVSSLGNNGIDEMYCFKFSQTHYNEVTPIKKNGMHFVDNTNAPYNIGSVTKAGEVYRLWARTARPGGSLLTVQKGQGTAGLYVTASETETSQELFSANYSSSPVPVSLDASGWSLPLEQVAALREVSETCAGGVVALLTNTSNGQFSLGSQGPNTVWLLSAPRGLQSPPIRIAAAADGMIADGTNRATFFPGSSGLVIENSTRTADRRSVALLKFDLPLIYGPDIQFALLLVHASGTSGTIPAQAHVYGITNTTWNETTLSWSTAPNVAQLLPAGASYTNNFVRGAGVSAFIAGQLIAGSTASQRMVDLTDYARSLASTNLALLIARELRFHGEPLDDSALNIISREQDSALGPQLLLIRSLDSDEDGISDEAELSKFGTDPSSADTDKDGLTDGVEILVLNTNPGTHGSVAPRIMRQPLNARVDRGETATFSVHALGSPELSYQWFFNTTNTLSSGTNHSLIIAGAQTNDAGFYTVQISNAAGSVTSSPALLEVTTPDIPVEHAVAVPYEPFGYEPGTPLTGQGGWILNAGTSGTIEAGSLDGVILKESQGNRLTWGTASMSLRLLLGTNVTSGDFYYSFLMRVDNLGGFTSAGTLAGLTIGTGTEFVTKLNIRTNGFGGYNLGTSKLGGTTYGGWAPRDFYPGEILFVAGRYRFQPGTANDTCDLWINPDPQSFGAATPPTPAVEGVGLGGADVAAVDRFFFRAGGSSSSPVKTVADELRLGRTWASVTPPAVPAVEILSSANHIVIRWPATYTGYSLQFTTELESGDWWEAEQEPALQGTNIQVILPKPATTQFYRVAR